MDVEEYLKRKKELEARKELLEAKEKLKEEPKKEKVAKAAAPVGTEGHPEEKKEIEEPVLKPWMLWNIILLFIVVGLFSVTYFFPQVGTQDIQNAVETALARSAPVTGQAVAPVVQENTHAAAPVENTQKLNEEKKIIDDLSNQFTDLVNKNQDKLSETTLNKVYGLINDAKQQLEAKDDIKTGITILDIKAALQAAEDEIAAVPETPPPSVAISLRDREDGEFDDSGKVKGGILVINSTSKQYEDFDMSITNKEPKRIRCFMDYSASIDTNNDGTVDLTTQKLNDRIIELNPGENKVEQGFSIPRNDKFTGKGDVSAEYNVRCYFCLDAKCDSKEEELKKAGNTAQKIIKKIRVLINSL